MKPWMAALTLTSLELTKHGYLATAGLDSHFHSVRRRLENSARPWKLQNSRSACSLISMPSRAWRFSAIP
jgi:hypothetical protein